MAKITLTNEKMFSRAFTLATFGEHRVRVGALITYKSTPIAGAWNTIRNTTTSGVDFTAHTFHAEDRCLSLVPYELRSKCTIYICRIDAANNLMPSLPCRFCEAQIKMYNLKEVVFWDETLKKMRVSH